MNPLFVLTFLFALASVNAERGEQVIKLNDAIIAKYGETPCLNKVIGQRLTHPTDPHKFLRCMSLESLWIETCPDGLFYNPSMEICDWSSKPRPTTRSNEVVKNRPVLFKTKMGESQMITEVDRDSNVNRQNQVVIDSSAASSPSVGRDVVSSSSQFETSTVSLLDELRKKLNMDQTTERPSRTIDETSVRRPIKLVEISPDSLVDAAPRRVQKMKPAEDEQEQNDFEIPSNRRAFLKEKNMN
jgi:hypothetical protein